MRKITALLFAVLACACSSSSDDNGDSQLTTEGQLLGTWKLTSKKNNAGTDVTTDCDIQYGAFVFNSSGSAVDKRGADDGSGCTQQTFTRDDFALTDGILVLTDEGFEYKYYASFDNGKLKLTKFSNGAIGDTPVITPVAEQISTWYQKQ